MNRPKPNTQGSLDSLCGLYALVHFLRDVRDAEGKFMFGEEGDGPEDRSHDAFWYVLDASNRLGMLSPDHIHKGYPAGHLVKIFNRLRDELGLVYKAVHYSDLAKLGKKYTFATITDCVLNDMRANASVVNWKNHYYLARGYAGQALLVEDSASPDHRETELSPSTISRVRLSYCFAILEESSTLIRCLSQEESGRKGAAQNA